jgi:tripartite-type tricarboxylate transporter receptor subunit TctC
VQAQSLSSQASNANPSALSNASTNANSWPNAAIHLVVPFQAGGSTDMLARSMAQVLPARLQQPVLVDNKPGGNATLGAGFVANAAPDGLTWLLVQAGYASNVSPTKSTGRESASKLATVSLLASGPLVLTVNADFPVKSVQDLLAMARAHPGEINFGSAGTGSLPHLASELINVMAGTRMTHIPYKGSAQALSDVLSGQVPVYTMNLVLSLPYLKTGKLRALAVTSSKRSAIAPEIPTLSESGLTGYDMSTWYGLLVNEATPKELVLKINRSVLEVLKSPEITDKLSSEGMAVVASSPQEFQVFLNKESLKFAKIIQSAGIHLAQ